jgi:hypothetical protein
MVGPQWLEEHRSGSLIEYQLPYYDANSRPDPSHPSEQLRKKQKKYQRQVKQARARESAVAVRARKHTLEPNTEVIYKVTDTTSWIAIGGLQRDDADLDIKWQVDPAQARLSDKDRKQPALKELDPAFVFGT